MISIIKSACLCGSEVIIIDVEIDISAGIPSWDIVGLPDVSVRESKERVRTAIKNCGIELKSRRYIINLSPSNIHKNGPIFDLSIAIGILSSIQTIKKQNLKNTLFIGELSLEGKLKHISGVLPIVLKAKEKGIKQVILPKENVLEASFVEKIDVIGVESLKETIEYLNDNISIEPEKKQIFIPEKSNKNVDFSEVKGQEIAKRALEIAATGNHNIFMIGPPRVRKNNACRENFNNIA